MSRRDDALVQLRKGFREKLEANRDKSLFVGGLWCGDFIGVVVEVRAQSAVFSVEKLLSTGEDAAKAGDVVTLPYGEFMTIRVEGEIEEKPKQSATENFKV